MCIPIVDSDIEHQLVARGSGSSNSSGSISSSNNNRSSSGSSDSSSSEGPYGADLDNGGQNLVDVSGGSTVSAADSDSSTSSGNHIEAPSRSKKYRRVAVHMGKDVVVETSSEYVTAHPPA